MEWVLAVLAVAVLGIAAVAASGRLGAMAGEPVRDRLVLRLPAGRLGESDVAEVRLPRGFHGYAVADVDDLLDRLGRELAVRDAEIARLLKQTPAPSSTAGWEDPEPGPGEQ